MGKVLCLLYHRVIPYKDDIYGIKVSPENFEAHMRFLRDNYNIVRFNDDWNNVPDNSIAITFDDGYMDNYLYAYPILQRYYIPATFFITTGNIDTKYEFWWDELERIACNRQIKRTEFTLEDDIFNYSWDTSTKELCMDMILSIRLLLRREGNERLFNNWFKQLYNWSGNDNIGRKENYSLTSKQIVEMSNCELIDIGGHTISHHSFGGMANTTIEYEIRESLKCLKSIINKNVNIYSYPFGGKGDYNPHTICELEKNAIKKVATTSRKVYEFESRYEIPRVSIGDCSLPKFKDILNKYMWESIE